VLVVRIPSLSLPPHLRLQLLVDSLLAVDILNKVGLLDDWRWLRDLLSEDVPLEEIRKPHGQLIVEETLRWDREDLCENVRQRKRPHASSGVLLTVDLFQGELFSLSNETEDHEPSDEVEPSIETD
jgi:hypothetical protein